MRAAGRLQLLAWAIEAGSLHAFLRAVMILVGLRRITPRPGERVYTATIAVGRADTGGSFYRPTHRPQDPSIDPREPGGGESSSRGTDHGWSNCTMASGADVMAFQSGTKPYPGDMRHRQGDLEGGTDLYDLSDAFKAYGETLTVRSGAGWSGAVADHDAGYALVVQGSGEVPGAGSFTGGHACAVSPEPKSDGKWLFGDPLVSDWQWIEPSQIKAWAQRWSSGIAYARGAVKTTAPTPPTPDPEPPPPDTTPFDQADVDAAVDAALAAAIPPAVAAAEVAQGDAAVGAWMDWLRAPAPGPADRWDAGSWASLGTVFARALDDDPCPDPSPETPALWARGPVLSPVWDAYEAITTRATWEAAVWRGASWAGKS